MINQLYIFNAQTQSKPLLQSMKNILLSLSLLLCFSISAFAQANDSQKSIRVKAIDSNLTINKNISLKLSPIKGLTNKNIRPSLNLKPLTDFDKKTSGIDITAKSDLEDVKWKVNQKFSEDRKDVQKFAKDYYLGDLTTTSKTVVIKCRDHEYVDGDRIKLMLNNAVIHPNITLKGDFFIIDIDLKEGLNTINFIALNEGLSSPNTAQLKVYDANGNLIGSNKWLIRTGFKASLTIIKE
jgi:hypothetical protein